MQRLR
jgi:two-component system sensor histidine kinase VicK